jgi:hypothetical protein
VNARTLRAAAEAIVPESFGLDTQGWRDFDAIVERALADRPPKVQRQFGLLLRIIEMLPLLRHRRRFSSLQPAARTRLLDSLQESRLLLLRRGIWGLRTLVFMGYYGRNDAAREIGYRASAAGWAARQTGAIS